MASTRISQLISIPEAFDGIVDVLLGYKDRNNALDSSFFGELKDAKARAVSDGRESDANACWCLEQIGIIQDLFIKAFGEVEETRYYDAWRTFERCEIELASLENNFKDKQNRFGIRHMRVQTTRFQELYPYTWFMSPAYLNKRSFCSICDSRLTLRSNCGHRVGLVYAGEICVRRIEEAELLHIAMVKDPVQKYSVLFSPDIEYQYGLVDYVAKALSSPWDGWNYRKIELRKEHPEFQDLGDGDPCPCSSTKLYGDCCSQKEIVYPHFEIQFDNEPDSYIPRLVRINLG